MERSCKVCRKWQNHFYWTHRDPTNVKFFVKMEASFRRYLNLPRKLAKNFKGKISKLVKLEGSSGKSWRIEVLKSDNTLSLRSGWRDFVTANKIDENDLLLFKYSSSSSFDVLIFDPSGCEKAAHSIIKNEQIESESETKSESESETEKRSSGSDTSVRVFIPPEKISSDSEVSSPATHAEKKRERNCEGTSRHAKRAKQALSDKPYHLAVNPELSVEQEKIADEMASATQPGSKLFLKILCSSDMRYYLTIPKDFSKNQLEKRSHTISLQVANTEKVFSANYCYNKYKQWIGSGWKEFALSNNLKEKDLCLFEVRKLGAKLAIVVHVAPRAN